MKLDRFLVILLLLSASVYALGPRMTTGKEWALWTGDGTIPGYIVIVANVKSATNEQNMTQGKISHLTLVPLASLAGAFDPSEFPSFETHLSTQTNANIPVPAAGSTIMAVMQFNVPANQGTKPSIQILSDICTFMPNQSPVCILTGLDDNRIIETLDRIRDARAHGDPNPYGGATTRPSTLPGASQ